jgi:hypothetical protein
MPVSYYNLNKSKNLLNSLGRFQQGIEMGSRNVGNFGFRKKKNLCISEI